MISHQHQKKRKCNICASHNICSLLSIIYLTFVITVIICYNSLNNNKMINNKNNEDDDNDNNKSLKCIVITQTYHSSLLEEYWLTNIEQLTSGYMSRSWTKGCKAVMNQTNEVKIYLNYWKLREEWIQQNDNSDSNKKKEILTFNKNIFSYYNVTHYCGNDRQFYYSEVPIEPLMGALRHPKFHCRSMPKNPLRPGYYKDDYRVNKDYMLPLLYSEYSPKYYSKNKRITRNYLFDLGASLYKEGFGGASQEWFVETYAKRGLSFDRIFAWEAQQYNASVIFDQYPPDIIGKVSYFNIPAHAEVNSTSNPLRILKGIVEKDDFVVFKLDIDNEVVELAFIEQIMNDKELSDLIDELYFEHHVSGHPLHKESWGKGAKLMNMSQSYELFYKLRKLGIRAHSWV